MNYALGLCFLAGAVVVAVRGDRLVQEKGGIVLRVFSWPKSRAAIMKFPIAIALAGVGIWFLLAGTE